MSDMTPETLFNYLLRIDHIKRKMKAEPELKGQFEEHLYQLVSSIVLYICEKEGIDDSKVRVP